MFRPLVSSFASIRPTLFLEPQRLHFNRKGVCTDERVHFLMLMIYRKVCKNTKQKSYKRSHKFSWAKRGKTPMGILTHMGLLPVLPHIDLLFLYGRFAPHLLLPMQKAHFSLIDFNL